jgi:hypothetical protein
MSFVLQVEDHTLAYRWAREVLCITAKWAADCLLWVKTRNYRSATAMAGSLSDNGHGGAKPTRAADVTVWALWSADACAGERAADPLIIEEP